MHKIIMTLLFVSFISNHLWSQTIAWEDSLSTAIVYLSIDERDYSDHPHRTSPAYDVVESDPKYHGGILQVVNKTLRKYPTAVLNRHVENMYIYDQFDKGDDLDGTYRGRHGFFYCVIYLPDGQIDTLETERLLHHEISHRLHMFEGKGFDMKAWKQNNALKYGDIKSYNRDFAPDLYDKGFINKYAVINKFEDFASFAENMFIYKPVFWNAIRDHEALRNKFEIACDFYESLDPRLNQAYFLEMNGVELDK